MKLVFCVLIALSAACSPTTTERLGLAPLTTVPRVDLQRYVGKWYEIARFPNRFQRGCTATTATYRSLPNGELEVVNRCRLGTPNGEVESAEGVARVVDEETQAKLEVSFFRPFWGDYWIIELAEDYSYAVVGHPSRDYLWVLARSPTMQESTYLAISERLEGMGYETYRLIRSQHVAAPNRPSAN